MLWGSSSLKTLSTYLVDGAFALAVALAVMLIISKHVFLSILVGANVSFFFDVRPPKCHYRRHAGLHSSSIWNICARPLQAGLACTVWPAKSESSSAVLQLLGSATVP